MEIIFLHNWYEAIQNKLQRLLFTRNEQQAFLEDISSLIEDGVPLNQAVEIIQRVASGSTKLAAESVLAKISQGKSIAAGMNGWFPQPIVEIIRAGEAGGTLAETMASAARALAQESSTISSLLGSLLYPIAVIILGLIVAVFIRHSIFVNFALIKPIAQWPSDGQTLYYIATYVQEGWWLMLLIIMAICFGIGFFLRNGIGELRTTIDNFPLISLYRQINAARFMETLGLLLTNGIILKNALAILQQNANPYMAWHLFMMQLQLSGGRENIAEVVDTGLINHADILRLRVIAKGKGFEHALLRLGQQAAKRNAKNAQLTGKIMGGLLLALGAGFAAFMIFAIYDVGSFVGTG